jgi:hypothetical protein
VRTFIELMESYEAATEELRALAEPERAGALAAMRGEAAGWLATSATSAATDESLWKLAVWHVDYLYVLLNQVDFVDTTSFAFVREVSAPLDDVLRASGKAIAYVVDNELAEDRLVPALHFLGAARRPVVSPEVFVAKLAAEAAVSEPRERYVVEATAIAMRMVERFVAAGQSFVWVSGEGDLAALQHVADLLDERYVGVFRNHAPEPGSAVQVFRMPGGAPVRLAPQY